MRLHVPCAAAIALAVGACADLTTQPDRPGVGPPGAATVTASDPQLLVCPTADTHIARATIGPEGGWLGVRGASITIPPGAVPSPTAFELIVPASPYMEIEINAVGADSYTFAQPATVTINYARCPDDAAPPGALLKGVYIDLVTNQVLAVMGGQDDKSNHKITFSTGHLSGYAVAY